MPLTVIPAGYDCGCLLCADVLEQSRIGLSSYEIIDPPSHNMKS